jgi:hypothetical protein
MPRMASRTDKLNCWMRCSNLLPKINSPIGPVDPNPEPKSAGPKLTRSSPNPAAKCVLLPEVVAQSNPYLSAIPLKDKVRAWMLEDR